MEDTYQPRRRSPDDDEDRPRRRPAEEDEDYPRDRAFRQGSPRPGGKKDVSVLGVIALVIGVLSLGLSLVPCLGLFTLPLPILGAVLALVGILVSAVGQRDGLGIPVSAVAVNAVACVLPIVLFFGMCGLGMRGAQQAAQQAVQQMQEAAEAERQRVEAERRQGEASSAAGAVGLCAGPQGMLLGYPLLAVDREALELLGGPVVQADLDQLLQDYDFNPIQAQRKYQDKVVRLQGTVERVGKDEDNDPFVVLKGILPRANRVRCEFDDADVQDPAAVAKLTKNRMATVQGKCEGRDGAGEPVRLSGCRLVK